MTPLVSVLIQDAAKAMRRVEVTEEDLARALAIGDEGFIEEAEDLLDDALNQAAEARTVADTICVYAAFALNLKIAQVRA